MMLAVVFAILVGLGVIGQWLFSLATGRVPELAMEPLRVRFHLFAEFMSAVGLSMAGIALLAGCLWGRWFFSWR